LSGSELDKNQGRGSPADPHFMARFLAFGFPIRIYPRNP
jgi:hypothetical protein